MLEINEKDHISLVHSTLNVIYNKARINGKLNSTDLYLLNILYTLINDINFLEIKNDLKDLYLKYYYTSKDICKINTLNHYNILTSNNNFIQLETGDCLPTIDVFGVFTIEFNNIFN